MSLDHLEGMIEGLRHAGNHLTRMADQILKNRDIASYERVWPKASILRKMAEELHKQANEIEKTMRCEIYAARGDKNIQGKA